MKFGKKYYNDFFRKHGPRIHDDPVRFHRIAKLCKGVVADFGCGTGALSDFWKGGYYGFDISKVAITSAANIRRSQCVFSVMDLLDPKQKLPRKFDTFVLAEFLEHIKDDTIVFDKIKKYIRPGGRIIVSVPNAGAIPDESHLREFTVPELRRRFSKLGRVRFHNYPGFKARILMTIDVGQKNDNKLGLVMIVKDEEKGLEDAILSCIEFVDQVVIAVDDASRDKTIEIAARYGDVVRIYKWENSFCKARNFAQKYATTEWVLHLDGHEYVEKAPYLDRALKQEVQGLRVCMRLENGFTFDFPRLVRSKVRWRDDVHNHPKLSSCGMYLGFIIVHDRKNRQAQDAVKRRAKQRSKMVRQIMHNYIRKGENLARAYFYLGQQEFIEKDFRKSIRYYREYLKHSKHEGERWLVYYTIARAYLLRGCLLRALWALKDAEKEEPGRWETAKLRGTILAVRGIYGPALKSLVESFSPTKKHHSYFPEPRDYAAVWDLIGWCLMHLFRYREAKFAWQRAIKFEKEKPADNQNRQRIEVLSRLLRM